MHAQEVADRILALIKKEQEGEETLNGTLITVTALQRKIRDLSETYRHGVLPRLEDSFDFNLFNTYRSYLFPKQYPMALEDHRDERGNLFEAVKSLAGSMTFISHTKPGVTRGDHFHLQKIERFLVLSGQARISVRKLFQQEITAFEVSGDRPQFLDIPTLHTHNITNTGTGDLITLFWSYGIFDPVNPDTFKENV